MTGNTHLKLMAVKVIAVTGNPSWLMYVHACILIYFSLNLVVKNLEI